MTAPRTPPATERAGTTPPPVPPAVPPHADPARTVGEARRGARSRRLEFLASEGGLLALSLMLALMIWIIVRSLVETTAKELVTVVPIVRPGAYAKVEGQVEIHLRGPRGEVEDAVTLLRERGNVVRLDVWPFAPESRTPRRPFSPADEYRFPFPERLLDGVPTPPNGVVMRLEQGRSVRVLKPVVPAPEDRRVVVQPEPDLVQLDAPAGALDDEIQPDPLDLGPLLDQTGRTHRVPLTFERWRRVADAELAARRAIVRFPPVFAVLQIDPTATQERVNAVEIRVKPGWVLTEITAAGFAGTLAVSETNPELDRVTFTGSVTATLEVLKALDERRDGWRWVLWVVDDDLPEPGKPARQVQARLSLSAVDERLKDLEKQHALQFTPLNVPVKVVSAKR